MARRALARMYDAAIHVAKTLGTLIDENRDEREGAVLEIERPVLRLFALAETGPRSAPKIRQLRDPFDSFLDILKDERTDLRLIRRCLLCPQFFYARRIDQIGCTSQHARRIRTDRWRWRRIRRVRKLRREGKTPAQIAEAIGTDQRTARSLLNAGQRSGEKSKNKIRHQEEIR